MPQSKEQKAAYAKKYYEKNKEHIKSKNKEYRKLNKEIIASKKKQHYYNVEYYKKNKEKFNTSSKEWYQNNKERVKESQRFNRHNIVAEEYYTMLEEQDHKCKICSISFSDITLKDGRNPIHIDHCHTTNQVRGLLCNYCNSGLGFFKDNTETLTNAIVYLEHTQEKQDETN